MIKGAQCGAPDLEIIFNKTQISMTDRILTSTYSLDSVGKKQGKPIFTEKGTIYETDFIIYNLKTKRAQIRGVITEQMGAFMHGEDVKDAEAMTYFPMVGDCFH